MSTYNTMTIRRDLDRGPDVYAIKVYDRDGNELHTELCWPLALPFIKDRLIRHYRIGEVDNLGVREFYNVESVEPLYEIIGIELPQAPKRKIHILYYDKASHTRFCTGKLGDYTGSAEPRVRAPQSAFCKKCWDRYADYRAKYDLGPLQPINDNRE